MSRVLVDQLVALAQRLKGGAIAGRQESTRKFWLIARQLRAVLPPLKLPFRTGSSQPRIGYVLAGGGGHADALSLIEREHTDGSEQVVLYLRNAVPISPISWAKVVDLNRLSEVQTARVIAEDDLDMLVDIDGALLQAMPLVIALYPARRIVEPAFIPAVSGDSVAPDGEASAHIDSLSAISAARAALDSSPGGSGAELDSPATLNARLNGGIQMHQAGDLVAARAVYEDVLGSHPRHPIAAYLLGQLFHQQHQPELAIAPLQMAADASPEFRDAHYTLAQRLADMRRWHEAAATYRRALDLTPGFAAGWSGLGLVSLNLPDSPSRSGISYLERATSLEPESAQWWFNLGTGWQRQGNLGAAREAYLKALQLDADHTEARFNLGTVAQDIGDHVQAIGAYRAVLKLRPRFGPAYAQLGACLLQSGQIEPWLENYREYRRQCAESLSMAVYGLEASVAIGDAAEHASWRDRIVAGEFPSTDEEDFARNWEQLLFLLLHVDLERGALLQWYRRYDEVATAWYGKPSPNRAARRPGPIRVGYLSGDLRDHVMGRMIFELVTHHDRHRFQPFLYALNASTDSWTSRFRDLGLPFVELATLPHGSAAARIRDDDLDILVDCSGHTRGAQQGILAVKPARVIATHIATPGPVGLKAIDYKLTDEFAESADAQQFLIERLWPVSGGVFPWHRYAKPAESTQAPGIRPGAFVCGAFVSLMKLSPRCLHLWRRILDRLPNAILAFSPPTTDWHPSYLRWTRAHGIGDERIAFVPHQRDETMMLGRYRMLDVALDPMPCGNVNGTMEALAMGVPVVTLCGVRHGERLGNALLRRYGVTSTIARNEDDYVDVVVRLAEDPCWAQALRERIRDAGTASAVWDSEARTRALEASFEEMLVEQGIRIP